MEKGRYKLYKVTGAKDSKISNYVIAESYPDAVRKLCETEDFDYLYLEEGFTITIEDDSIIC